MVNKIQIISLLEKYGYQKGDVNEDDFFIMYHPDSESKFIMPPDDMNIEIANRMLEMSLYFVFRNMLDDKERIESYYKILKEHVDYD